MRWHHSELPRPVPWDPDEEPCPRCDGAPMVQYGMGEWGDCPDCGGYGTQKREQLGIDDFEGFCPLPP